VPELEHAEDAQQADRRDAEAARDRGPREYAPPLDAVGDDAAEGDEQDEWRGLDPAVGLFQRS
jgi:hypothetical protein